jgi:hypothetical protein
MIILTMEVSGIRQNRAGLPDILNLHSFMRGCQLHFVYRSVGGRRDA